MKRNKSPFLTRMIHALLWSGLLITVAQAGSPLWTFAPLTDTVISIPVDVNATVKYQITNQSRKPHTLVLQPISGITQVTTPGNCSNPFVLNYQQSCTLTLNIAGDSLPGNVLGGPRVCQQGNTLQCYQPSQENILKIELQTDPVTAFTEMTPNSGTASGGTGVTLTGTGLIGATGVTFDGIPATNVNVVNSTKVTAVTPAHAAGAVDVVINTPAGSATLTNGYTYLATAIGQDTGGGKIGCLNPGNNLIVMSTTTGTISWGGIGIVVGAGAQSNTDGAGNTAAIVAALGNNGGVPYAAQLCNDFEIDSLGNTPCQAGNACYNDWFLPAGNNTGLSGQLNCLSVNFPALGGTVFWSSTELNNTDAWGQLFGVTEFSTFKGGGMYVRCVRSFTP